MEMLLRVVENADGDVEKADEAERLVIEEIGQMGSAALQSWAENQPKKKTDEEENSIEKYRYTLPRLAKANGFIYIGFEPYVIGNVAFVGTCSWYDYSFRNEGLDKTIPESAYRKKRLGNRRWMDAVYCNWSSMEDAEVASIMNESVSATSGSGPSAAWILEIA
jgi:hypothetical protein